MELYDDDNIDYMFLLHGYKYGKEPLTLRDFKISYDELLGLISNSSGAIKYAGINKENFICKTKEFFNDNFSLHNISYMPHDVAESLYDEFLEDDNKDLVLLQNKMNENSKLISPFDLPINYIKGVSVFGNLLSEFFFVEDVRFMTEQQIRFSELQLGSIITPFTSILCGHEIVHTQLESLKGSIENLHDKELLPIFIENVLAFEFDSNNDLLRKNMLVRCKDMFNYMRVLAEPEFCMDTDLHLASGYMNSVLQASNLFDKYICSNLDERKLMLEGVQNVFDGKSTVEDFLGYYDVTLENSSNLSAVKKYLIK